MGFDDVCPSDILSKFKNTKYAPPASSFLSGTTPTFTFNDTLWGNISSADAFPSVMLTTGTADVTSVSQTITTTGGVPPKTVSSTIRIFSILKIFSEDNSIKGRYTLPSGTGLYDSKGLTDLQDSDPRLLALYTKFKTINVPGGSNKIINSMDLQVNDIRYSASLDLMYSLRYEYCYWAKVLRALIADLISVQGLDGSVDAQKTIKNKVMNVAASVNYRLLDLAAIITYLSSKQGTELNTVITDANQYVTQITTQQGNINKAMGELTSKDGLAKLRSRMVEYNEEKNNYASSLLSLYGFANLIAIGLLFYIYKS